MAACRMPSRLESIEMPDSELLISGGSLELLAPEPSVAMDSQVASRDTMQHPKKEESISELISSTITLQF